MSIQGWLAVTIVALGGLTACVSAPCREARAVLRDLCGEGIASGVADETSGRRGCEQAVASLTEVREGLGTFGADAQEAGRTAFCNGLVPRPNERTLDATVAEAQPVMRRGLAEHVMHALEERLEAVDTAAAEVLLEQLESVARADALNRARLLLASAYANPSAPKGPPPDTARRSIVAARRNSPSHSNCTREGAVEWLLPRDLDRARELYVAAGNHAEAARVAYLQHDLEAYDAHLAEIEGERTYGRALQRLNLLVALGLQDEARLAAEALAVDFLEDETCALVLGRVQCSTSQERPRCEPMAVLAMTYAAQGRYTAARNAYEAAGYYTNMACGVMARGRLAALENLADGQSLAGHTVRVEVRAPSGVRLAGAGVPDVIENDNPVLSVNGQATSRDPGHLDHRSSGRIVLGQASDGVVEFSDVPDGTWNLIVVADGPDIYEAAGSCWLPIVVQGADVDARRVRLSVMDDD